MACKDLDNELNTMLRYNFNKKNSTHICAVVKEDKIKINYINNKDFFAFLKILKINEFIIDKYNYNDNNGYLHISIDLKNNSIWDINDIFQGYGVDMDDNEEDWEE